MFVKGILGAVVGLGLGRMGMLGRSQGMVRFRFSVMGKMPMSAVQTVISYVDSLKNKQVTEPQLQQFNSHISNPNLSNSQRKSLKKYLLSTLYNSQTPTPILLSSPSLTHLYTEQPSLEILTMMYIIVGEMTSSKPDSKIINDLFVDAFERVLKRAGEEDERVRCEVLLFKNYGRYMIESGEIGKGIVALEKSVQAHRLLVLDEYHRMQSFASMISENTEQNKKKTKAQKQRQKLQLNAQKQNIRRLIESTFETSLLYYSVRRSQLQSSTAQQAQQITVEICTLIQQALKLRTLISGIQLYSRLYHRLRKIQLELEYAYALMKRDKVKAKNIVEQMREFVKLAMEDLEDAKGHIEVQKEIAKAIFAIQLHLMRLEKGDRVEEIKSQLSGWALKIIQRGKLEQNQKAKQIITKLLADFMKKNIQ